MRGPGSGCCWRCDLRDAFDAAAGLLATLKGQLVPGPMYSDQMPPSVPQPHKVRPGIPWTALLPTIRVNAPSNPDLILNPVTSVTWYLRPMARLVSAPRRRTIAVYSKKGAQSGNWGASGYR